MGKTSGTLPGKGLRILGAALLAGLFAGSSALAADPLRIGFSY
jgi:hypothetical protein